MMLICYACIIISVLISFLHQLAGVPLENVTYEVETQLFCDLPFYINNNQVMLNVSEVQETGRDTLYDVVISATAAQDTALFRMTNLSTGRVHTVVRVDGSE